jgi:branched-subunit amino acid permease
MELSSAILGLIFTGVGVATLLIIIFGSRKSKDHDH